MKEIYDWVPWFRELAGKIAEGGEAYLIEKAKQVDWVNEKPALLRYGSKNIDPFSFFYFLASKKTKNQLKIVYESVRDIFKIKKPLPDVGIDDYYIFPTPQASAYHLFHDGENFSPDLFWRFFRQVAQDAPTVDQEDFQKVLEIKNVGVAKLTQTLFLINPEYFLPIDDTTEVLRKAIPALPLSDIKKKIENGGYEEYQSVLKKLKEAFPGCQPYGINTFLYLQKKNRGIKAGSNFFQVSTQAHGENEPDHWEKFKENNCVYTGGPGKYPLEVPIQGDIILVRMGKGSKNKNAIGKAIGIVYKNYRTRRHFSHFLRAYILIIY